MWYSYLLPVIGLILGGCTVYAPVQPTMPLLTEVGQAEIHAGIQLSGRLEAVGAYSPAPHMLLTGAGTVGVKTGGDTYLRTRQAEFGIGGYREFGTNGLLTVIGGGGLGVTRRRTCLWGCDDVQGRTSKLFGQVGAAWELPNSWLGLTYRLAYVEFYQVSQDAVGLTDFGSFRHEIMLFRRQWLFGSEQWFAQSTLGLSISSLRNSARSLAVPDRVADARWEVAGVPTPLLSIGIGWQPAMRPKKR